MMRAAALVLVLSFPTIFRAADAIPSAEAAVARFRVASESDIQKVVPPEIIQRITSLRDAPFLMVARKSHVDVVDFLDPKVADALDHHAFFGSREALAKSAGDIWVLTYGNMSSLTVYLDASSGAVLCVAFIPEG
jgi:hypothetical protein